MVIVVASLPPVENLEQATKTAINRLRHICDIRSLNSVNAVWLKAIDQSISESINQPIS